MGALTFSRPKHNVPTYLAFMAVSDGRNKMPSLSNPKIHIVPQELMVDGKPFLGYQGCGLGLLMIRVMEKLAIASIQHGSTSTCARIPLPKCYLHYNSNNNDSADGWI